MRRTLLPILVICLLIMGCRRRQEPGPAAKPAAPAVSSGSPAGPADPEKFVTVRDGKFILDGQPYRFVGANFWQWSGGMAQYVSWHEKTPIPYPGDDEVFINFSAKFYACAECQTWFRNHIEMLVARTNPYTGLKYRDDPAIFSWELGNEPRRYPQSWIDGTATTIKSLDPHHMVTTGSEEAPPEEPTQDFVKTHGGPDIDYVTIHIWPQNWGWFDPPAGIPSMTPMPRPWPSSRRMPKTSPGVQNRGPALKLHGLTSVESREGD